MATQETQQIDELISNRRAMLAAGGLALAGLALGSKAEAQSTTLTDNDILNFALNLEYLEAQYYSYAAYGVNITSGPLAVPVAVNGGTAGTLTVKSGTQVNFTDPYVQSYAQETAMEEAKHVLILQKVLGSYAVSMPAIDLLNSFNSLAVAAGIASSFDPFSSQGYFLLGAFIFEDTGVSAYHGAAGLITGKTTVLPAALGIHAVEAYHAGIVRTTINRLDAGSGLLNGITQKIAAARTLLGTTGSGSSATTSYDTGISTTATVNLNGSSSYQATTIVDANMAQVSTSGGYSIAAGRTTTQVLQIVTGQTTAPTTTGSKYKGVFFPSGLNGLIS